MTMMTTAKFSEIKKQKKQEFQNSGVREEIKVFGQNIYF